MPADMNNRSLTWVHFGDLHMRAADQQNHQDFLDIVNEVNTHLHGHVDFCLLPGDNADNGQLVQYLLIKRALAGLQTPVHIIPGDHDREPGDLAAFHSILAADRLPKAISINGYRCLFLDIVSAGSGGPDFRLGADQLAWLERELVAAQARGEPCVVYMHAYPADLKADRERVYRMLRAHRVLAVDMGHTHYNELANDGRIIFATTRSTGQVEEGPVGFSVMNLEDQIVSWRFKPLESSWPFVMITSPADEHLATDYTPNTMTRTGRVTVSARAWSAAGISTCRCRLNDDEWILMDATSDPTRWLLNSPCPEESFLLTVEAEDRNGFTHVDSIRVATSEPRSITRIADGSDADAVGAWHERHILGTQLGPNRNGRHW